MKRQQRKTASQRGARPQNQQVRTTEQIARAGFARVGRGFLCAPADYPDRATYNAAAMWPVMAPHLGFAVDDLADVIATYNPQTSYVLLVGRRSPDGQWMDISALLMDYTDR